MNGIRGHPQEIQPFRAAGMSGLFQLVVLQFELKQLQKQLGVTLVFVTHDQEEALAMSDRIAVMNAGKIEQIGTPAEIYARPRTRFVADFIGEINLFEEGGKPSAIRPEKVQIKSAGNGGLPGRIETANFLGGHTLYRVVTDDGLQVLVKETNLGDRPSRAIGEQVAISWDPADVVQLER